MHSWTGHHAVLRGVGTERFVVRDRRREVDVAAFVNHDKVS
jgi:hypothetical protein